MVKRAVEMEGTVTGEHGVGLVKRDYLNHELGETTVDAMRRVCPLTFPFCPMLTIPSSNSLSTPYAYLTQTRSSVYRNHNLERWTSGRIQHRASVGYM